MRFILLDSLRYTASCLFLTYMQNCFFIMPFYLHASFHRQSFHYWGWVWLVFFIFGFQLAFLCNYSLDIEFWVTIRNKFLFYSTTRNSHSLSITHHYRLYYSENSSEGDAFYLRSTIRLKIFWNVKKLHKCRNRQRSGHFGGLCHIIFYFFDLSLFGNYLNNNIDSLLIKQSFNYIMINIIYHHCYTFLLIAIITVAYCYLISCWLKICTSL